MEKKIFYLIFGILLISFGLVFAQSNSQGNGNGVQGDINVQVENDTDNGNNGNKLGQLKKIMAGNYIGEEGQEIQIKQKENNRIRLRVGEASADTDLEIEQEKVQNKTKLKVKLSNGRNAEIKIMPNTASERALERLRLKVCSLENNCTIQLKEVGKGNETKLAYELQAQRHAKLLGMFRLKMQVKSQVDAESGEVIRVKKPWWAFLTTDDEESETADEEIPVVDQTTEEPEEPEEPIEEPGEETSEEPGENSTE